MILYDFSCPIDGLQIDLEDTPLVVEGTSAQIAASSAVGKHLHLEINQQLICGNGHTFGLTGSLLLSRSA